MTLLAQSVKLLIISQYINKFKIFNFSVVSLMIPQLTKIFSNKKTTTLKNKITI